MPGKTRWTSEEKIRIVMESMNTNITLAELCRKYNLNPGVFRYWQEKFIHAGKLGPSGSTIKDPVKDNKEAEINRLKKLIGELTIANGAMISSSNPLPMGSCLGMVSRFPAVFRRIDCVAT